MEIQKEIEGLQYTFKPASVRTRSKFLLFLAQVAGGNLIYDFITKGGLSADIDPDSVAKLVNNLGPDRLDQLVDQWIRPQIIVPKAAEDDKLWEELEDKQGLKGLGSLIVFFVMWMVSGNEEAANEIKKKFIPSEEDSPQSLKEKRQ